MKPIFFLAFNILLAFGFIAQHTQHTTAPVSSVIELKIGTGNIVEWADQEVLISELDTHILRSATEGETLVLIKVAQDAPAHAFQETMQHIRNSTIKGIAFSSADGLINNQVLFYRPTL